MSHVTQITGIRTVFSMLELLRAAIFRTALLLLLLSEVGLASIQDDQGPEDSWLALAFEEGDFEAARIAALGQDELDTHELIELLRLTEPDSITREFVPASFFQRHDIAIARERSGATHFDSESWPGQNYLCKRWEAWCLRNAFVGLERWEINMVFNYLKELKHAGAYRPQLERTLSELNDLYDSAEEGGFASLWECLEKEPPRGWKVVQANAKVSQRDLAMHATGSDGPVVLMPGSLLDIRPSEVFKVPTSCRVWLARGFKARMPKEARLDLGGCVLTFGAHEEPVQFHARSGSWSGVRLIESERPTTWIQDWELKRCRMGVQVLISIYKPVLLHRSQFLDCEVGVGGEFVGAVGDNTFTGTSSRLFAHECRFDGAERVGLAIGAGAHVASCEIEDAEVGIQLVRWAKVIVAYTSVRAVLPLEVHTGHDCLMAFGCSFCPKSKGSPRVHVHASSQMSFEGNYWGAKQFRPGYIAYVGPASSEPLVLCEDLIPLDAAPKETPTFQ